MSCCKYCVNTGFCCANKNIYRASYIFLFKCSMNNNECLCDIGSNSIALEDVARLIAHHLNSCPIRGCRLRRSSLECFGWFDRDGNRRVALIDRAVAHTWLYYVRRSCPTFGVPILVHSLFHASVSAFRYIRAVTAADYPTTRR